MLGGKLGIMVSVDYLTLFFAFNGSSSSVLQRGNVSMFFEKTREGEGVVLSHGSGDGLNGKCGVAQKLLRCVNFACVNILLR